jgi:hypothetical protein
MQNIGGYAGLAYPLIGVYNMKEKYTNLVNALSRAEQWDFLTEEERKNLNALLNAQTIETIIDIDFKDVVSLVSNYTKKRNKLLKSDLQKVITKLQSIDSCYCSNTDYI